MVGTRSKTTLPNMAQLNGTLHSIRQWFVKNFRPESSRLCTIAEEMNTFLTDTNSETSSGTHGQYRLHSANTQDNEMSFVSHLMNEEIKDRIAFRAPGNISFTYGALREFVKGAGNLSTVGCSHGEKVAYLAPYGILGAAAFVSIASQCVAIPLDPESSPSDLYSALLQLKPDCFIIFDDLNASICSRAKETAASLGIRLINASGKIGTVPFLFTDDKLQLPETPEVLENKGSDTCLLLRTSGTTSEPKIVPLTTASLLTNALAMATNLGLTEKDVALNAMPLFHIGGIMTNLLASFLSGSSSIFLHKFDISNFIETLVHENDVRPTWFSAVPTMLAAVQKCIGEKEARKTSLRFIRVGAAAISNDLIKQSQDTFGCRVIPTYSMTECMPISQPTTGSVVLDDKPGSVGKALNVSMCIVDSNLVPLSRNDENNSMIGEVCISGPTVMNGYLFNKHANDRAFFTLGSMIWFRTGDLGYLDQDDFLFLTGRKKEMIKVNGDQVSPIEVEDACMKFPGVEICVAFSQPSNDEWGERVGIACVISNEDIFYKKQFRTDICRFLKTSGLADSKIPSRVEIVQKDALPKTKTGKYIRTGLASALDKVLSVQNGTEPPLVSERERQSSPSHSAAVGSQFVLALAVMYVHIGNLNEWVVVEQDGSPTMYHKSDRTGGYASEWSNTRTWCFHTPLFFFVGGFLLATGAQSHAITSSRDSLISFYKVRMLSQHPMYLVSVLLCTGIMIARCTPRNFIDEFDRTREPLDEETFVCQATPVEMSWVATLLASIFNYFFLLQAWPMTIPISWFLSYYTWFSSVYMFCIFVFPWCHKPFFLKKNDRRALWRLTLLWTLALYVFVGAFSAGLGLLEADEATLNWFALYMYLFPPGWLPCFSIGIGACFLLKEYKKTDFQEQSAWVWGVTTDVISFVLLLGWIGYGLSSSVSQPLKIDSSMANRYWAAYVSRLVCPVAFLWFAGLAMGKGFTVLLLSRKTIVRYLAPASYNCFLFHQPIGELYFYATRGGWWAYPKTFYWFSPYPLPVTAWEIPIVMTIVVLFSMAMHFYVNEILVSACTSCLSCRSSEHADEETNDCESQGTMIRAAKKSVSEIVLEVISRVSHTDHSELQDDTDLAEIGLSSIALPVAISGINLALKRNHYEFRLSVGSLSSVNTIGELVKIAGGELRRSSLNGSQSRRSFRTNERWSSSRIGESIRWCFGKIDRWSSMRSIGRFTSMRKSIESEDIEREHSQTEHIEPEEIEHGVPVGENPSFQQTDVGKNFND